VEQSDPRGQHQGRVRPIANIDCMAVNYMEDGTRSAPAPINAFHKSPSAIIGNGDTMVLPDVPATIFEGEAEMAVVIGKRASHVKAADAMDYVFGYTNFIDGSARGLPPPATLLPDEVARHLRADRPVSSSPPTRSRIRRSCRSGCGTTARLMQNFNTDDMAHKIPRCIEWLTSIHTLEPGDILATGTNHRGLNPFMDGDKIELVVFAPIAQVLTLIREGKLRALGVSTAKRTAALPDVPAIGEFVPGYDGYGWYGLGAPAKTPPEIINKLSGAMNEAVADPMVKERFSQLGVDPMPLTPDGFAKHLADEIDKWAKVIKAQGIQVK
jgi:2-keto-4-pentenoate hydratase/2-oxohepta-3-ene-1,7-dioic acid hydratase in catechol pathway